MTDSSLITRDYVNTVIKERPRQVHKGQCGRVLVIAGSKGMTGAAVLATTGALRSGAGLVTVGIDEELFPILQIAVPQAMCRDVSDEELLRSIDIFDSIAIGPGIGVDRANYLLIRRILLDYEGKLIIDADGINNLFAGESVSDNNKIARALVDSKADIILTPHEGEANRILACIGEETVGTLGREKAAKTISQRTGAVVLLKGADTIVCSGEDIAVNTTGNPGMATGGSGDVLTGVITAIAGSGASVGDSARCGAYIHGMAGDIAAAELGQWGMTSLDIGQALPQAFKEIVGK